MVDFLGNDFYGSNDDNDASPETRNIADTGIMDNCVSGTKKKSGNI
jgi:hypothetical protein